MNELKPPLWLVLILLGVGMSSCGNPRGDNVSFFEWYANEFQKGAEHNRARRVENDVQADRSRRFWIWFTSPEGKHAIYARTEQILVSRLAFPDTVYEMSSGSAFKISSQLAGATLTGSIDHREGFAFASLRRADGSYRQFRQGVHAAMLGDLGEGDFDEDEKLVAALLRSNPRSGWPGRAFQKTHPKQQEIAANMWQEITGEKLRGYSVGGNDH
jgi:hypothetical protein